ncbi:universal stress protein [Litoribacter ruber]|uniref:Universal stress protein n=1 Tax=Litoribacter ruber TaxID=702568 RepID=A0AAP2G1H0_9BACT|nr:MULTISPECIES: universal stress protein [Litoribacter]MBS9524152.1 universal stress protein [Litoribacter alkaliphilus]MBT0810049.1 universal stress protein [Litoribacter ruber]
MKKRLILLIDFSKFSEPLVKLAHLLAKQLESKITLVHQVPSLVPSLSDLESREQLISHEKEAATSKMLELIHTVGLAEEEVSLLVTEKNLSKILNERSVMGHDDIVMLGLKGTGFLKKLLIGSTVTKIIEETNKPIIAIPSNLTSFEPSKFVVAVSYRFPVNEDSLQHMLETFKPFRVKLEFITVVTKNDNPDSSSAYLLLLEERFRDWGATYKIYHGADAFKEIKSHVHAIPNSYLVAQKGSRTLNDQLFRNFMLNDLIHDGSMPLLILPK